MYGFHTNYWKKIKNSLNTIKFNAIKYNSEVCQDGHEMKLQVGKQNRWRCYVKESRKEIGIRIGTWFEGTKIPFKTAIFFIYCWSYEMVSVDFCKRELEMNHNTVVDWGSYFREVCLFMEKKCQSIIGRKGFTVEVDETLFTRRKNHCGRMLTQQWCFGRICCETKECFVRPVPNRSSNTLIEVLRRRVRQETLIISDM
uniref:DDE_Tnp_1_7 domain-containing protein n=1 Tax=Strongyloides stercoralis TaxID=6248 RepID=A0A913HMB6_STRER